MADKWQVIVIDDDELTATAARAQNTLNDDYDLSTAVHVQMADCWDTDEHCVMYLLFWGDEAQL